MSQTSLPLEPYAGPLDLLMDEVRRQKIAIEDVALAPLVARYLGYMEAAATRQLPLDIDWILWAARLIHWKSRALLAPVADTPADPIRDELVEQLQAHRQEVAGDLGRRRAKETGQLSREADPAFGEAAIPEEPVEPAFLSVWDLTEQARELARWAVQRRQELRRLQPVTTGDLADIPVADMVEYLLAQFAAAGPELSASQLLFEQPDSPRRVSLFLAMLDMAQSQQLRIRQNGEFAEICLLLATP